MVTSGTDNVSAQQQVQNLMKKCEPYSKMVKEFQKLDLSFSEEPGKDKLPLVIIDGSNVAMRRHSPSTIHGHEYLEKLSERGLVSWAPSKCYDDRPMLEEARAKTGWIVTNDRFVDFGPEWKETKKDAFPLSLMEITSYRFQFHLRLLRRVVYNQQP
ncbi:hypothetical protein AALO_G00204260 [Alosa alosa]|uniref:RNase NYN domain-containing protein n=1 Tax=Alosa alosa TaxID=278164 RepID=A0AAV6G845_9TELE|nr:hypothetical protein AALO_G00204260 [Alosa alosa]